MKRIVYVTQRFPVLTETFTTNEVIGLASRSIDVAVQTLRPPPGDLSNALMARAPRAALVPIRLTGRGLIGVARPSTLRSQPRRRVLAALRGGVLAGRIDARRDHLHAQFPLEASSAALYAARASGATFSFSGHTYHDLDLMREKLAMARFVVVGSQFEHGLLGARYGDRWSSKIRVQRLGVPERLARTGFRPRTIVAVGTLAGKKGHDVLIRATAEVVRRGHDVRVEVLGEGPERLRLEELIHDLGLEAHVSLPGACPHEEVIDRIAQAEIFALCCRETAEGDHDCLPVALMDGMSVGTPCVSSAAFGIPELIEDGVSGLLAPPDDHVAIADRLERLLADQAFGATIGSAGQAAVRRHYDLERNLDALAGLFQNELG